MNIETVRWVFVAAIPICVVWLILWVVWLEANQFSVNSFKKRLVLLCLGGPLGFIFGGIALIADFLLTLIQDAFFTDDGFLVTRYRKLLTWLEE